MKKLVLFVIYLVSSIRSKNDEGALDIAAFNVRVFGVSKLDNNYVLPHLVKIILRYDIILIQEIRDSTGKTIQTLLKMLNKVAAKDGSRGFYNMTLSPRLGRTSSKEEYAFIYRCDIFTLISSYTFSDPNDVFEREPYIVRLQNKLAAVQDFAVAAIHTSPRAAKHEISNLTSVYDDIVYKWGLNDVIIMGDFNAGCTYVRDWSNIKLATDKRFYWLHDNSKDTTTEKSDCPYDRMVVAGKALIEAVLPQSAQVFHFDEEFGLNKTQTLAISDHYPIEMKLRLLEEQRDSFFSESIKVKDERITKSLENKASLLYKMRSAVIHSKKYKVVDKFTKTGAYVEITVSRSKLSKLLYKDAMRILYQFHVDFPSFVSNTQLHIGKRFINKMYEREFLPRGHSRYQTLYDYYAIWKTIYAVELQCDLLERTQPECYVYVDAFIE